jgi:hypothetical protein
LTSAVLDNDIVIKAAMYSMLSEVGAVVAPSLSECGVLGALRFVLTDALERQKLGPLIAPSLALLASAEQLEPSPTEATAAAEIELSAQQAGLQLDAGESLLFAIAEARKIRPLVTGDKRAIAALEKVLSAENRQWWKEGVVCLEQVVLRLIAALGATIVRNRVCSSPKVDTALAICFSCSASDSDAAGWQSGLVSYIEHLRKASPTLLAPA